MNDISHLLELTNHLIDFDAAQSIPSHGQHEQPPHNIQSTVSSCRNEIEERLNHLELKLIVKGEDEVVQV